MALISGVCNSTPALTTTPVAQTTPAITSKPTATPTPTPNQTETPTPTDTTPPSAITGLIANNAYDGRVNLRWDKNTATDFDHYNIYVNNAETADVTGMKATQQITDITTCRYQVTALEDGTSYYFAVTAADKSGNEDVQVTSVSAGPSAMPRGTVDPELVVDVYQSELSWAGTTLLADNHISDMHSIIEVNMLGEVVWQYLVPQNLVGAGDVELLPNDNILFTAEGGVYEIDRSGKVVWQYLTCKCDHDADRLPNGNTIFVFGMGDQKSDAQVTEVNPEGNIVWQWYARDYFDIPPEDSIYDGGWVHTNAVTRLTNGNTLISLRNFNFVVEVDPQGAIIRTIGEEVCCYQHDPEIQPDGNILFANHDKPHKAIELAPNTGEIIWEYTIPDQNNWPVRDADRLPNGNTLITGTIEIVEVTPEGEVVWRLGLQDVSFSAQDAANLGFYKADRID